MADVFGGGAPALISYVVVGAVYVLASFALSRLMVTIATRSQWSEKTAVTIAFGGRFLLAIASMFAGYFLYLEFLAFELALSPVIPERWTTAVIVLEVALGAGLTALAGVYAVHRGFAPLSEALCSIDHSAEPHHRRRKWLGITILLVGQPAFMMLSVVEEVPMHPLSLVPGVLTLVTVALYLCLPFSWVNPAESRDPTPEERDRLARCYERFDRTPEKLVLFSGSRHPFHVFTAGRGRHRWTWIRESFFEDATEDELAVALAQADEKNQQFFEERMCSTLGLSCSIAVVLVSYALTLPELTLLNLGATAVSFALLGICIGIGLSARGATFRADAFACDHLDPERVRETYIAHADSIGYFQSDIGYIPSRFEKFRAEPTIEERIERIEQRCALESRTGRTGPVAEGA